MYNMIMSKSDIKRISREKINLAPYNPRKISDLAREKLAKSMKTWGMVQVPVWNKRSGNLVSGHQRISILDEINQCTDYTIMVMVVNLSIDKEKALNIALNNKMMQGDWDMGKLRDLMVEIDTGEFDLESTGFNENDLEDLLESSVEFADLKDDISNDQGQITTEITLELSMADADEFSNLLKLHLRRERYSEKQAGKYILEKLREVQHGWKERNKSPSKKGKTKEKRG